jgi:hypothetical protein
MFLTIYILYLWFNYLKIDLLFFCYSILKMEQFSVLVNDNIANIISKRCRTQEIGEHLLVIYKGINAFKNYNLFKISHNVTYFEYKFLELVDVLCPIERSYERDIVGVYYLLYKIDIKKLKTIFKVPKKADELVETRNKMIESWNFLRSVFNTKVFKKTFSYKWSLYKDTIKNDVFYNNIA